MILINLRSTFLLISFLSFNAVTSYIDGQQSRNKIASKTVGMWIWTEAMSNVANHRVSELRAGSVYIDVNSQAKLTNKSRRRYSA